MGNDQKLYIKLEFYNGPMDAETYQEIKDVLKERIKKWKKWTKEEGQTPEHLEYLNKEIKAGCTFLKELDKLEANKKSLLNKGTLKYFFKWYLEEGELSYYIGRLQDPEKAGVHENILEKYCLSIIKTIVSSHETHNNVLIDEAERKIIYLKDDINELNYKAQGVGAVQYDKAPGRRSTSTNAREKKLLKIMEEKEKKEKQIVFFEEYIKGSKTWTNKSQEFKDGLNLEPEKLKQLNINYMTPENADILKELGYINENEYMEIMKELEKYKFY